jgi:hypothetical protein
MGTVKKIGIVVVLIGLFIPTVTLPFIKEFHPLPNICLTSNFFGNLGNMVVSLGESTASSSGLTNVTDYKFAIPYRYLFTTGVILFIVGIGIVTLSGSNKKKTH